MVPQNQNNEDDMFESTLLRRLKHVLNNDKEYTVHSQESSALEDKSHPASKSHLIHLSPVTTNTTTYIDKSENPLRTPKKYYEDGKKKRKTIKKLPKRTVQKIIKQSKSKNRRNFFQATIVPTEMKEATNLILLTDKSLDGATTELNAKKKSRKNVKLMRYPMPFQKLPFHYRYRRDNERDVYILKDLDEIKFLDKEDGQEVIEAHVKKYW